MAYTIKKFTSPNERGMAKVSYDTEYGEHIVRFYIDGEYIKEADYFTNCRQDAFDTAAHHCKHAGVN